MQKGDRIEFSFWEAGCLIWVGCQDLGGLSYEEFCNLIWGNDPEKLKQFVLEKKAFMPMNLYQNDGYSVRVVLGELNEQETEEWVARVRWKLNLSSGKMVISGIADEDAEYFRDMPSAIEQKDNDYLQCYVEVPPGEYQVEVYSYAPGDLSTGWGQIVDPDLFTPSKGIEPESLKNYFNRTRPNEEPPAWIGYEITDDDEKLKEYATLASGYPCIDFIVKLSPVSDELPIPELEDDGYLAWEFRKPERCPLGIPRINAK